MRSARLLRSPAASIRAYSTTTVAVCIAIIVIALGILFWEWRASNASTKGHKGWFSGSHKKAY